MTSTILIRYDEIGLKGHNKSDFIHQLEKNITAQTGEKTTRSPGRIYLQNIRLSDSLILEKLKKVFGIASFSPATQVETNWNEIKKAALELTKGKTGPFKVEARREDKSFEKNSQEINAELGELLLNTNKNLSVDVHSPDLTLEVEVRKNTYLAIERSQGPGGLPVGVSGRALALLSGGIDSPVAAWFAMKRGTVVDAIHFHSPPYTGPKNIDKVGELARALSQWSPAPITLYIATITEALEAIKKNCPEGLMTILQRRFMYRIAEKIAEKNKYQALVTGESIGQVASQTIENINCTAAATNMTILRPLVGFDKKEIIAQAKHIGTYETSILPHHDCCTVFAPKNPATKANLQKVEKSEKNLPIEELLKNALKKAEARKIKTDG